MHTLMRMHRHGWTYVLVYADTCNSVNASIRWEHEQTLVQGSTTSVLTKVFFYEEYLSYEVSNSYLTHFDISVVNLRFWVGAQQLCSTGFS